MWQIFKFSMASYNSLSSGKSFQHKPDSENSWSRPCFSRRLHTGTENYINLNFPNYLSYYVSRVQVSSTRANNLIRNEIAEQCLPFHLIRAAKFADCNSKRKFNANCKSLILYSKSFDVVPRANKWIQPLFVVTKELRARQLRDYKRSNFPR